MSGIESGARSPTSWDPEQYRLYSDHRFRPAVELAQRIPGEAPRTIYDLGCGTGNVTRLLAARWPDARVVGMDHSPEMLAIASRTPSTIRWVEADLNLWEPEPNAPPDLLFSNATLHWVADHERLFPKLLGWLAFGGCLAVQMPRSWGLPSHRIMRETLADTGLGSAELRQSLEKDPVGEPLTYHRIVSGLATHIDIWETEYLQLLEGPDPVLEWVKGTGLRPILLALSDAERKEFLDEYARRLRVAYPAAADGRTLYPFRRLFVIACV